MHKAERRLDLMKRRPGAAQLPRGAGAGARRPQGARRRLPHPRGSLFPGAPQSAQRLFSVDPGVLSERPRISRRARREHVDPGGSIMIHGLPEYPESSAGLLRQGGLDRWLHSAVGFGYGGGVADDARQHADRNPALSAASRRTPVPTERRRPGRGRCARGPARQPGEPVPGRDRQAARHQPYRPVHAVPQLRARGAQFRQRQRQRQGDLRALRQLRRADRAARLGHQARDHQRAGRRVRRWRDDPRHQGASVRGAARHHLHLQRDHRRRPAGCARRRVDHQRRVPHPAQCARAGVQGPAESGRVLGRALDRRSRIPLRQARRLRARPARPGRVHRLRTGRDEGADEGRRRRPCQAAHHARPFRRPHRARHHRRRAA